MKVIICTVFSIFLLAGDAMAGTVSTLRDVGFSANGRYFAFTTTENDGMSETTCRTTTFINTLGNAWIGQPLRVCKYGKGDHAGAELLKLQKRSDRARIEIGRLTKKLNINFNNDGQRVVYREAFRYWKNSGSADKEFSKKGESLTFSVGGNNRYRLMLSKTPASSANCQGMATKHSPAAMSLHIRNLATNQNKALQVDRAIPKVRRCPFHYRIQNVYTHQSGSNKVVVTLLQYFNPSVEGPDERYLAVSGEMN